MSDLRVAVSEEVKEHITLLQRKAYEISKRAYQIEMAWKNRDWITLAELDVIQPQIATRMIQGD